MKKIFTNLTAATFLFCGIAGSAQTTAVKRVLLEEFTTTLCGFCPPKSHDVNEWHDQNKAKCVMMTHHAGFGTDQMTNTEATGTCNGFTPTGYGFAPAVMIDRDLYPWVDSVPYMAVHGFDSIAARVSNNTADVAVDIQGTYNSTTRSLNVTVTANFVNTVLSGNHNLYIYLMEDSVTGTGTGYDQKCYDATFANTYYPGQYVGQYITQYPHRTVQRKSLAGGTWGVAGVIPSSPAVNTPYSSSATFTVPANYNDSRLYIVAYVARNINKLDKNVLNANDVHVKSSFSSTGSTSVASVENSIQVNSIFPNPASDVLGLAFTSASGGQTAVWVTDISGRTVIAPDSEVELAAGRYERFLNISTLQPGIYFLTMRSGSSSATQKFIVER